MSVVVKICGMTSLPDAMAAVEAGANALGFVFYERSPRNVSLEAAAAIAKQLPPYIVRVGVFVDAPQEVVSGAIRACGLNLLQFHGNESPGFCLQFGIMSMKAFRVRGADSLDALRSYPTDAWLLDAYSPSAPGGTGESFDWALARTACAWGRPVFLAGGLTPENVAEAIARVQPYAVDVSSGVEREPGVKDPGKLKKFINACKSI
jgi:phosphoribosylanthranilate isomerase